MSVFDVTGERTFHQNAQCTWLGSPDQCPAVGPTAQPTQETAQEEGATL